MFGSILTLNFWFLVFWSAANAFLIPYSDPLRCNNAQYFQYSSLKCVDCAESMVASEDSLSCVCRNGFYLLVDNGGPVATCKACPANHATSKDGWSCVKCAQSEDFNPETKTCTPCASREQIVTERQLTGKRFDNSQQVCVKCVGDTQPSPRAPGLCSRCDQSVIVLSGGSCVCPVGLTNKGATIIEEGGKCLSSAVTPLMQSIPPVAPLDYHFLQSHIRVAQTLCKHYQNFTACQLLGNLCVLYMYNQDNFNSLRGGTTDPCNEYLLLQRDYKGNFVGQLDWPATMPWLYYSANANEVLSKTDLDASFRRGEAIQFIAVKYSVSGHFLSITNDTSFLHLCESANSIKPQALQFTTSYTSSCKVNFIKLRSEHETIFYDLFLSHNGFLYPVPVLVDNLKFGDTFVNRASNKASWKLTRRFFLLDKISGHIDPAKEPLYIRYASSIVLDFRLTDDGNLVPPLLKVKYNDFKLDSGAIDVARKFEVTYEMNAEQILENVEIAIGVLSVLGLVYATIRIFSWRRREGTQLIDCSTFLVFFVFACSALSFTFWIVIFVTCGQWFLFFKHQTAVIMMLPTVEQEALLKRLLLSAFIMKAIDIFYIVYSQINLDLFFIDWERPRGSVNLATVESGAQEKNTHVSIMRTLFVGNEWREIQTNRRIKPTLQLVLVLFFFKVVGFENLCTTDPISRYSVIADDYVGEYSFTIRLAVISLLFMCVAIVQWILFGFFYERFVGDMIGDFIDFCSMSNISIFLMSRLHYGYYIHGRSVHGRADCSLHELYEQFQREEESLCGKRGLEANSDQQTFEFALTAKFRQHYSRILQPLLTRDIQNSRRAPPPNRQNPSYPGTVLTTSLERSVQAYNSMNHYLANFIEHAIKDNDYVIRDKLLLERLLKIELQAPMDKSMFYNDEGQSFTEVLLYGQEWNLVLFHTLLFLVIDWLANWNSVLAAVVCYFVDVVIVTVRDSMGRRNLARKTMVDERFLI